MLVWFGLRWFCSTFFALRDTGTIWDKQEMERERERKGLRALERTGRRRVIIRVERMEALYCIPWLRKMCVVLLF